MTAYTHAFVRRTGQFVKISDFAKIANSLEVRAGGFDLVYDMSRAKLDQHGRLCRDAGGWSYGHMQRGNVCAGAGGLNSLVVA